MKFTKLAMLAASAGAAFAATPATAQIEELQPTPVDEGELQAIQEAPAPMQAVSALPSAISGAGEEPDPEDAVTARLNAQQKLQQTFTLKRTVNGELVETTKRTVIIPRDGPQRVTEAGGSLREQVAARFDGELMTRTEAQEEARLDFAIADTDRNGLMNVSEFEALVEIWRDDPLRGGQIEIDEPSEQQSREQRIEEFLAEISPDENKPPSQAASRFAFIAGAATTITRDEYLREHLLDFDAMDADNNRRLEGAELMRFRALNRGEEPAD